MNPQKIVKVKKIGIRPTVDIEVDSGNHIFYGNGIATSNSHGISYAINAYLSAYAKAHFPKIFFASYLRFAKDKIDPQDEIKALVQNANEMDITVHTPDIRHLNEFFILKNNKIYFGLTDIKGVGKSVFDKIVAISQNLNLNEMSWLQYLFLILNNINSTAAKALIQSGSLNFLPMTRNRMLFEYNLISSLTKKECENISSNIDKIKDLKQGLELLFTMPRVNKNRKASIEDSIRSLLNPPYALEDSPEWIADNEDTLLGCAITCSRVDMYDISMTNTTCRDFKNGVQKDNIIIGGEIAFISVVKTKTGKDKGSDMCFVNLTDQTGCIDSVIFFPEKYKTYKNILFEGNVIIISGNRSKSRDSLVVEKAYIAKT